MSLELKSTNKVAGGELRKYSFKSSSLGGLSSSFNLFLPSSSLSGSPVPAPALYYLAGLTCTEDNGAQKGDMLNAAGEEGVAVVFPDTSPRGAGVQGEEEGWDFGTGAGFYINADKPPFDTHYRMYDFVVTELPSVLQKEGLPLDPTRRSIFGHSMGGHGALSIYLREPGSFRSCSAFAPISHPVSCPWGKKAFSGYFTDAKKGEEHDATLLLGKMSAKEREVRILVDCGTGDQFYEQKQLLPEAFEGKAREVGYDENQVKVRMQQGYDHSYYFISTFAPEHVRWHAKYLKA